MKETVSPTSSGAAVSSWSPAARDTSSTAWCDSVDRHVTDPAEVVYFTYLRWQLGLRLWLTFLSKLLHGFTPCQHWHVFLERTDSMWPADSARTSILHPETIFENTEPVSNCSIDAARLKYQEARLLHWNEVSRKLEIWTGWGGYYHRRLTEVCQSLVSPGQSVLELGCARGDLLAALKPALGVGVDFS